MINTKPNLIKPVPSHPLIRFFHLGSLTTRLASRALISGTSQLLTRKEIDIEALLVNERNASLLVSELHKLRGAALKLGQLISLETEDILPKRVSEILNELRKEAYFMPRAQVQDVLVKNWGKSFL